MRSHDEVRSTSGREPQGPGLDDLIASHRLLASLNSEDLAADFWEITQTSPYTEEAGCIQVPSPTTAVT